MLESPHRTLFFFGNIFAEKYYLEMYFVKMYPVEMYVWKCVEFRRRPPDISWDEG
jgi:hypothetical protein